MSDELVERCRQGDATAFEQVYRQHAGALYRHLRALLDASEIDDALQQTFSEAFRGIRKFSGRSALSTWLHGIAVHVALNVRRARKRRVGAMGRFAETQRADTTATPSFEGAVASHEQLARLEKYLAEEPEDRRAAFIMYYVEELDIAEIAEVLGVKPDATLKRIERTRARILDAIAREQRALQRRATDVA